MGGVHGGERAVGGVRDGRPAFQWQTATARLVAIDHDRSEAL